MSLSRKLDGRLYHILFSCCVETWQCMVTASVTDNEHSQTISSSLQRNVPFQKNKTKLNPNIFSYLAISVWCASPITMFLKNGSIQKTEKLSLSIGLQRGRPLVSLAKFLMEPGMERAIHDARIPSDTHLQGKSRQGNVQSWSEKEGKVFISIFSDGSVISTATCHCISI